MQEVDLFDGTLQALMDAPLTGVRKRRDPKPSGHAYPPGTGPEGERCGTCANLARIHMAKTYLKCELARSKWTHGHKSDVRAGDAACKFWAPKP